MSSLRSRRIFLAASMAAVAPATRSLNCAAGAAVAERTSCIASGWKWQQLVAHRVAEDRVPIARDPWNGMLAHGRSLFLFGGAYAKYGPPRGPADLTTLGVLNDLWRFDLGGRQWQQLDADDGRAEFTALGQRPCGRVLPAWAEVDGQFYLFGGLTVLGAGWRTRLLSDLWTYNPAMGSWSLIEADDGRMLEQPTQVSGPRPTALAAMGVATVGTKIYLLSGWGGQQPSVVLSPQLWSYDVSTHSWEHLGSGEQHTPWPAKRYCAALTAWQGKLYLWGGRDTQDRAPQFYNDLWRYDPLTGKWEQLQDNRPVTVSVAATRPAARYAMGQARIGACWYLFGGFGNERGNSPQLNDLWRLDLAAGRWSLVEPHNGAKDISAAARRPSVRRVPAMTAAGESVYVFGGLDLTSGADEQGPLVSFNDLWQGWAG